MEQNFTGCSINMMKLASSSQAKVKHVMPTAVSALDGHNLLEWMK
jgi:hypothetical protein